MSRADSPVAGLYGTWNPSKYGFGVGVTTETVVRIDTSKLDNSIREDFMYNISEKRPLHKTPANRTLISIALVAELPLILQIPHNAEVEVIAPWSCFRALSNMGEYKKTVQAAMLLFEGVTMPTEQQQFRAFYNKHFVYGIRAATPGQMYQLANVLSMGIPDSKAIQKRRALLVNLLENKGEVRYTIDNMKKITELRYIT
jgi:hypothetical protein